MITYNSIVAYFFGANLYIMPKSGIDTAGIEQTNPENSGV